jgi:hypothetical protein
MTAGSIRTAVWMLNFLLLLGGSAFGYVLYKDNKERKPYVSTPDVVIYETRAVDANPVAMTSEDREVFGNVRLVPGRTPPPAATPRPTVAPTIAPDARDIAQKEFAAKYTITMVMISPSSPDSSLFHVTPKGRTQPMLLTVGGALREDVPATAKEPGKVVAECTGFRYVEADEVVMTLWKYKAFENIVLQYSTKKDLVGGPILAPSVAIPIPSETPSVSIAPTVPSPSTPEQKFRDKIENIEGRLNPDAYDEATDTVKLDLGTQKYMYDNDEKIAGSVRGKTSEDGGVEIVTLDNDSPLRQFGAKEGDIVVAVNGEAVKDYDAGLAMIRRQFNKGMKSFKVDYIRNGERKSRMFSLDD